MNFIGKISTILRRKSLSLSDLIIWQVGEEKQEIRAVKNMRFQLSAVFGRDRKLHDLGGVSEPFVMPQSAAFQFTAKEWKRIKRWIFLFH